MIFNFFATERVFRVAQYDGINDFVAFDLSGEKRPVAQVLVGEFHSLAVCSCQLSAKSRFLAALGMTGAGEGSD